MYNFSIFDELLYEMGRRTNYPPTNGGILEDGTPFIEIAVTGHGKDDLTVEFDEVKRLLTVKSDGLKIAGKYTWRNLSTRAFTYSVKVAPKYEVDDVQLHNGLLTITFKESEQFKGAIKSLPIN